MTTPRRKFSAAPIISRHRRARRPRRAASLPPRQLCCTVVGRSALIPPQIQHFFVLAFIFLPVQENEAKEHAKEGTQCLSPPWRVFLLPLLFARAKRNGAFLAGRPVSGPYEGHGKKRPPPSRLRRQPSAQVAIVDCSRLWLQTAHRAVCLTRRPPQRGEPRRRAQWSRPTGVNLSVSCFANATSP